MALKVLNGGCSWFFYRLDTLVKMLAILTLFITCFGSQSFAGTWYKFTEDMVFFDGTIQPGEFEKFKVAFDDKIKILMVMSGGGSVEDALQIAEELEKIPDLKIIVRGKCLSSCANYFFTAAKVRVIENGIVGFHGNNMSCNVSDEGRIAETRAILKSYGLDEPAIDIEMQALAQLSLREQEFFKRQGVSLELFDVSCLPDKGMNDGKIYSFLLPSPETFEKYGIKNVTGEQNQKVIERYKGALIVR